jgi:hypothetical protein
VEEWKERKDKKEIENSSLTLKNLVAECEIASLSNHHLKVDLTKVSLASALSRHKPIT